MKQFLFIAIAALALLSSCQRVLPNISAVTPMTADVPAKGGTVKVNVTSSGEWRTSTYDDGVTVNPSSGSGNMSVTITVPANTSAVERDLNVMFFSAEDYSVSKTVTIHQDSPGIEVDLQEIDDVPATGGTYTVNVTSIGGWTATAGSGATISSSSYTGSDKKAVTITVAGNTTEAERDITVTFTSALNAAKTKTVTIHQDSPGIEVDLQEIDDVPATGGTYTVNVTSIGGWTATAGIGVTISSSSYEGSDTKAVAITVSKNTTEANRDITVTFTSSLNTGKSKTVIIHQNSPDIEVDQQEINDVPATSGTYIVNVTSAGGWSAVDTDFAILDLYSYEGSDTKAVKITVYENTTDYNRDIKVIFKSKLNTDRTKTVTIHQNSPDIEVDQQEINDVPATGGTYTVNVTSAGGWVAIANDGATFGSESRASYSGSDTKAVKITVYENTTDYNRIITVAFFSYLNTGKNKTVTFLQKSPDIDVDPQEFYDVPVTGGTYKVNVTSAGGWVAIANEGATFGSESRTSYSGSDTKTVTITVAENTIKDNIYVTVMFASYLNTGKNKAVTFHQNGLPASPETSVEKNTSSRSIIRSN